MELGQCSRNHVHGDALFAKNQAELPHVPRNGFEHVDGELVRERHFARVGDRAAGLFAQGGGAPVPELGQVERRVEHGGRVDRALLPFVTDRGAQVVGAAAHDVVAGVARNEARHGQARLKEQLFAQLHLAQVDIGSGPNGGVEVLERIGCSSRCGWDGRHGGARWRGLGGAACRGGWGRRARRSSCPTRARGGRSDTHRRLGIGRCGGETAHGERDGGGDNLNLHGRRS